MATTAPEGVPSGPLDRYSGNKQMATAPPTTDAVLASRLAERDRAAWDEVYREYGERLYRFAYRLTGNSHDAADLVQETFVRVLVRLDHLDAGRTDLSSYLFKTAQNVFLRGRERAGRVDYVDAVPEPVEPTAIEDDPQRSALLRRQQEEVRVANGHLAPRQRLVLALCELEDKSYAEIGELVGLNENAVAQLISRARQSLRHELRLAQVDRSRLPESCQQLLPQLSAYLDGQLKGPKREETIAHLLSCEHCQAALADMDEARRRYRAVLPPAIGAVALKERIDDALGEGGFWEATGEGGGGRAALLGRPRVLVIGATLLAALVLGGVAGSLATRGDEVDAAATPAGLSSVAVSTAPTTPTVSALAVTSGPSEAVALDVVITDKPPKRTVERNALFAFISEGPAASFRCRLDRAPAVDCASPRRYSRLAVGEHSFSVRPIGEDGTAGGPERYTWVVIEAPPATAGTTAETDSGESPSTTADAAATTEPAAETGKKPKTTPAETEAQTPKDTTPPTIVVLSMPPSVTTKDVAVFRFDASEPVSSVECSLDGGGWRRCYTPTRYSGLGVGPHGFCVRAIDRAKNVGPSACVSWTVQAKPVPETTQPATTAPPATAADPGQQGGGGGADTGREPPECQPSIVGQPC